jgi:hypothetical protein
MAGVLHDVHGVFNEMYSQAPGPNIIERPSAQLFAIGSGSVVDKHDLETRSLLIAATILQAAAQQFDRLPWPAVVGVANNIGQSFIDGAGQASALLSRKPQFFGQSHHCAAHDAQDFGITGQFKSKEPARAIQFEASLRECLSQTAIIRTKSILVQCRYASKKIAEKRAETMPPTAVLCSNYQAHRLNFFCRFRNLQLPS